MGGFVYGERWARAYNGDLGAVPPVGSRGKPGLGVQGQARSGGPEAGADEF